MSLTKQVCKLKVVNPLGLHTRPATALVQRLQRVKSDVAFTYRRQTINAKSIMSILMLAVPKGGVVTVSVQGEDAADTMDAISSLFSSGFGEL